VTDLLQDQRRALEPLRRALLADARAQAARLRLDAEEAGRRAVADAEVEVAGMLARARAMGEAEGAEQRAADEARVRSAARARVLAGRRATYEELRHRAQAAVRELLQQPGQRELLAETLRARLGDHAAVSETDDGGLRARAPDGRAVDASVGALVDQALAAVDLEQLWTAG
jgi:hypothetical protein